MRNASVIMLTIMLLIVTCLITAKMLHVSNKPIRGYLDMISLDQKQRQKVEEIRKAFLPKVEAIRRELRSKRLQLNDLLFTQTPDVKAIKEKSKEISDLQAKLEREVIDHILQERDILTPEQKKQFYEIIRNEFEKGGLGVHGERRQESSLGKGAL